MAELRRVILRQMELKGTDADGSPIVLDYAAWCRRVIERGDGRGFGFDEMVKRLPIINAIGAATEEGGNRELLLEQGQLDLLVAELTAPGVFPIVSAELVEMVTEIKASPSVEVAPVEAGQ